MVLNITMDKMDKTTVKQQAAEELLEPPKENIGELDEAVTH